MLMLDRGKMQHLSLNTGAPFAMAKFGNEAGLGCGCGSGLSGLGLNMDMVNKANQFNPEPISRSALQAVQAITQFFQIGQGRMEADRIVPIQNQIHHQVLQPVAEAVNADYASQLSQSQLQSMLDALLVTKKYWLDFLHNTDWVDGRAATQAENTLAFLFDDQEQKLRQLMINAPYWGGVENAPEVIPVGGGATSGSGSIRYTPGGVSNILRSGSSILPWVLVGLAVMALPKIGKYQR